MIGTVEVNIDTEEKIKHPPQHQVKVADVSALPKQICHNTVTTKRKRYSKALYGLRLHRKC